MSRRADPKQAGEPKRAAGAQRGSPLRLRRRRRIVPELEVPTLPRRGRAGRAPKAGSPAPRVAEQQDPTGAAGQARPADAAAHRPLYWRVLRLHHVHPTGWQRALLIEGVIVLAVILVLAGVATAWTILVLPVVVAVLVKAHDLLVGAMAPKGAGSESRPSG